MEDKITIQKENLLSTYNQASEEQKALLENMFGKDMFQSITESVKTFEDACEILGSEHPLVKEYWGVVNINLDITQDLISYLKLRIICTALNGGWAPTFSEDEYRYYPWFYSKENYDGTIKKYCNPLWLNNNTSASGSLVYANGCSAESCSLSFYGARLALRTEELAKYCGKQFIDIWADFFARR